MKEQSLDTVSSKVAPVEKDPLLRPAFFVLVVLGEQFADGSLRVARAWGGTYQSMAGTVMTVLQSSEMLPLVRAQKGKCLVVVLEANQNANETHIGSVKSVQAKLLPILKAILAQKRKSIGRAMLLGEEDDNGQLLGTVLLLDDKKDAVAYCHRALEGEERVPGESFRSMLQNLITEGPKDYEGFRAHLAQLNDSVRMEMATALEPAINAEAQRRPHATYEEKKELAKWINAEIRRFGLALKAPKTGHPCLLVATTGYHPTTGRFVFDYVDEHGKRQHPMSSVELPPLELTLDDLARAPYGGRVSPKR